MHWRPLSSFRLSAFVLLAVIGGCFDTGAIAAPVTYVEVLRSTPGFFSRDLSRTRTLQDGRIEVEDDDATLVAEHVISDSFGFLTFSPIHFSHTFVNAPTVARFLSGSLTLEVYDPLRLLFTVVLVEGFIPIGLLAPADPLVPVVTTFSTNIHEFIAFALADRRLDVGLLPIFDFPQLLSSRLEVQYETPEPGSIALLSAGLTAVLLARRRHAYQS